MSRALLILCFVVYCNALALDKRQYSSELANNCDAEACKLPDCRCSSTEIPGGLSAGEIPQMVMLTFDDAVNAVNFEFYKQFFDRTNPDGCPIGTTYFVSHEYTDYTKVHELHARGHEIALHSVTHKAEMNYWKDIAIEEALAEFGDELEIISRFANVPKTDVKGLRVPFLQLSGNTTFIALKEIGLSYDATWPTLKYIDPGLWPYTLDYKTIQDCPIGPCPTAVLPGTWVFPMIDWKDEVGTECAMVDSCQNIPGDIDGIVEFMKRNFLRHYNGNRAPFGVYLHASWFYGNNFDAYVKFLDYLQGMEDVYLVSMGRALEWIKNPMSLANLRNAWPECQPTHAINCNPLTCRLDKGQEERWMTFCGGSCPLVYPWLNNPMGS